MKKNLLLLASFALIFGAAYSQIPNPSFETWSNGATGSPDGWYTLQLDTISGRSTDAHAGSYSVFLAVRNYFGNIITGTLLTATPSGGPGGYYHETTRPAALHGWYKLNSVDGDLFQATINIFTGHTNGGGTTKFGATNVYKEFVVNILYNDSTPADSAQIGFIIVKPDTAVNTHAGSTVIFDDLSYGPAVSGIDEFTKDNIRLEGAVPNPSYSETDVIYSINSKATVNLAIYDITGKEMIALVNETQTPGRYKAVVDTKEFPAGTYIYKLVVDGQMQARKLVVLK